MCLSKKEGGIFREGGLCAVKTNVRVVCPKCGADLGPVQPLIGTLTGCRKCHVWVNNAGDRRAGTPEFAGHANLKGEIKHKGR